MLDEVCAEINNYFVKNIYCGKITILGGKITPLDFLQENQYFRIVGSVFNDGVYQYTSDLILTDENFEGQIWAMGLPPAFIALVAQIKEYAENEVIKPSVYSSESFGGYSYTKNNIEDIGWRKVFAKKLNRYRKISGVI